MTIRCQQEKDTLVRFLRRTNPVEGDGFDARRIGRSGYMVAYYLVQYPKWRTESQPALILRVNGAYNDGGTYELSVVR